MTLPELGSTLPEIVLRTAIVYFFLVLILRVTGKREVGQMSILELIVILVISDAVQNSMVGENTSLWGGLVAVVTLFVADNLLKFASRRSQRLHKAARGRAAAPRPRRAAADQGAREEGVDVERRPGRRPGRRDRPARGRPARRAGDRRVDQHHPDGRVQPQPTAPGD